jgi:predicted Zn-dependent protease
MKKTIYQGLIIILLFCIAWASITKIDLKNLLKVEELTTETEEKIGDILFELFKSSNQEINDPFVVNTIDSIVSKICFKNGIQRENIKLHILKKDEINAFALPNGHLVIYSGLIASADNQEELSGVIGHEIAHIQLEHVMKKLINEFGLSILISMTTTAGNGTEIIKETGKLLSSASFSRKLEKEADIKAVNYLLTANIDPEPFANFLYKLSMKNHETTKYISWISTHPESKKRAEDIIEYIKEINKKNRDYSQIISEQSWENLKQELFELPD